MNLFISRCRRRNSLKQILPLIFLLLAYSIEGLTQTTTIDYTSTIPANCNVFASSPPVSGYQHFNVAGQPTQPTVSMTKTLETDVAQQTKRDANGYLISVTEFGTAYNIKFPFTRGYSYSLTFTIECGTQAAAVGNSILYFGLTNTNAFNAADCLGPETGASRQPGDNISVNGSFSVPSFTTTSSMNTMGPYQFSSLSNNYNYLSISVLLPDPGTNPGNDGNCPVYIKNIKIVQIPETFHISPATVTVQCGQQTTQIFTAVNTAGGTTGVTGYTWNLGANNGWLYNGSPAPASIITATNAITLTSTGGTTPPNSVSLSVNGVPALVSPATATINFICCLAGPPAMITGLTASSITATSAVINWNAVPNASYYQGYYESPTVGINVSTNSATLTGLTPTTTYTVNLVAGNCRGNSPGVSMSFTTPVLTCFPPTGLWFQNSSGSETLNWGAISGAVSYDIQYSCYLPGGGVNSGIVNSTTNSYTFTHILAPSFSEIVASVRSECGGGITSSWSSSLNTTASSSPNGVSQGTANSLNNPGTTSDANLKLYPIPSSGLVTLSFAAKENGTAEIALVDLSGVTLFKKILPVISGTNTYTLDISKFSNGVYTIKLNQSLNVTVQKLIIQK